jgi:hypothetical protein
VAGRPNSLRAVRESLFTAMRIACSSWRATYVGRAPLNDDVENAFLRLVRAWESFMSDWSITAVVRDPSAIAARLDAELQEWVAKRYGLSQQELQQPGFTPALKASLSLSQPTYEDLRRLLDPRGRNVEFDSLRDFTKFAKDNVAQPYRGRLLRHSLSQMDQAMALSRRQLLYGTGSRTGACTRGRRHVSD